MNMWPQQPKSYHTLSSLHLYYFLYYWGQDTRENYIDDHILVLKKLKASIIYHLICFTSKKIIFLFNDVYLIF